MEERTKERKDTHHLSFQKGFLKLPFNISASVSPARSLLHGYIELQGRLGNTFFISDGQMPVQKLKLYF